MATDSILSSLPASPFSPLANDLALLFHLLSLMLLQVGRNLKQSSECLGGEEEEVTATAGAKTGRSQPTGGGLSWF